MSVSPGALDNITVVDFSRVLAGPHATMMLADFGARVIKLERDGVGDETRQWGPPWHEGEATYYLSINRNKEVIPFDFGNSDDVERVRELVKTADVVVENFRPGTMERYGFGYTDLAKLNPRLVYASITGFGSAGGADLAGYDLIAQATGGLMSITGDADGEPTKVGVALMDVTTGLHAVIGILTALRHRDATGQGQHVEVNLLSSTLGALVNQSTGYAVAGNVPYRMGNAHPSVSPYQPLQAADRPIAIAAATNPQFAKLTAALGRAELADDERFRTNSDRVTNREALVTELESALSTATADEWFATLRSAGVPAGPINDMAQAVAFADELGLNPIVYPQNEDPSRSIPQIRNPISLSLTPATYRTAPPALPTRP